MKTLLFIYNSNSGKGKISTELSPVVDLFSKAGYVVTTCPTQCKGDATRLARELGESFDRVICAGGDGTLSETVSGLLDLQNPPVLGYIPTGSTNDCAATLQLPKDPLKAAALVAGDTCPRLFDIGRLSIAGWVKEGAVLCALASFMFLPYGMYSTKKKELS